LRRDCSHRANVSFGSFEEHRRSRRQSQFVIPTLAIFRAVKQPWIVLSKCFRETEGRLNRIFSWLLASNRLFSKRVCRFPHADSNPSLVNGDNEPKVEVEKLFNARKPWILDRDDGKKVSKLWPLNIAAVLTAFKGVKDFSLVVLEGRLIFMDGVKLLLGPPFWVGDDDSLLALTRPDVFVPHFHQLA